jgi:hypothetical protein
MIKFRDLLQRLDTTGILPYTSIVGERSLMIAFLRPAPLNSRFAESGGVRA